MFHRGSLKLNNGDNDISSNVAAAIRDGNEDAYIMVYESCVDSLKQFLIYLTGSANDAEEFAQEVFIRLWEQREMINPDKNIKSYIFRIAKNMVLNHIRDSKNFEAIDDNYQIDAGEAYVADESMIAKDTELLIEIAIESMPVRRRKVFRMYRDGMSHEEISKELGITASNVRKYVMRARKDIKDMIAIITFFLLN